MSRGPAERLFQIPGFPNSELGVAENYVNRFLRSADRNKSGLELFEDPTYLTFRILLDYSFSPLFKTRNNLVGGESNLWRGFETITDESAEKYFFNRGDRVKLKHLSNFIGGFDVLIKSQYHYLREINGLEDLIRHPEGINTAYGWKKKLTIKTYESVDMRMAALWSYLRTTYYDYNMMRWSLPENLRKFDMTILIYDIRDFYDSDIVKAVTAPVNVVAPLSVGDINRYKPSNVLAQAAAQTSLTDLIGPPPPVETDTGEIKAVLEKPYLAIKCYACEFDITQSLKQISTLSSETSDTPNEGEFSIIVDRVRYFYDFSLYERFISDQSSSDNVATTGESQGEPKRKIFDNIKENVKRKGEKLANDFKRRKDNAGESLKLTGQAARRRFLDQSLLDLAADFRFVFGRRNLGSIDRFGATQVTQNRVSDLGTRDGYQVLDGEGNVVNINLPDTLTDFPDPNASIFSESNEIRRLAVENLYGVDEIEFLRGQSRTLF